ncbi:hypothetical protein BJ165DRAFT_1524327 [Panaeolus papilionaceus]|nr:hypothetical protein BJ165DRAFT_1524327 [Panaeolus papilionaceus]
MSHLAQSTVSSTSSQEFTQQTGPTTNSSIPSKRRRDTPPNGNGAGGQSAAIHQGTSRLMALMQQEQAALASTYQEKINSLSRKVKATQEQVDYLTQVAVSGSDLLATRNEFQKKLDDAQKVIQQQMKANAKILDAIRRNGMELELVSTSDGSGQKVDLRFNNHTQEVISKFFHLPDPNTPVSTDPSLAQLATSKNKDLTPQQFFALLQNAVAQSQSTEGDVPSNTEKTSNPAPDDAVTHPSTNDIPPESTTT